ncbi:DUF3010 family protein [Thalassotalea sp. Y01]|uniref:DUF3010 family protein n=1 Tax=Thalassotalea sp. Y01 TaxID=2729613 RepID=UPI00145D1465|nr:DUF3010 family protein [Thalassotalea sp. Y01]NMP15210.1 DUF3010 family protein [Thalassotalea sp. Y01]
MRVCGVEIKGDDAIICLVALENNLYDIPYMRVPKISLQKGTDAENIRKFQFTFAKLVEDYKIDAVVIKERATKGKFAGGSQGFKIEAAIQLIDDLRVDLVRANVINEKLKKSQVSIDFRDTGLKQYQQAAFETAFTSFNP